MYLFERIVRRLRTWLKPKRSAISSRTGTLALNGKKRSQEGGQAGIQGAGDIRNEGDPRNEGAHQSEVDLHFAGERKEGFTLDTGIMQSLQWMAEHEQRTPEEIANAILDDAFRNHRAQWENWQRWQSLTPREQEITALICQNCTNKQIAEKLCISPETVKTHVEHILSKFDTNDRFNLRLMLNGWDFSGWKI
jgi:DNA-binding CsgD family transcriptional regulator